MSRRCGFIAKKAENSRAFFAAGQTNEFLQFKGDLIYLPLFQNTGYFSIRSCRPLPHAKLSGANPEIGTRRVDFSAHRPNGCY